MEKGERGGRKKEEEGVEKKKKEERKKDEGGRRRRRKMNKTLKKKMKEGRETMRGKVTRGSELCDVCIFFSLLLFFFQALGVCQGCGFFFLPGGAWFVR
jgi:hypothetical protein